MNEYNIKKAFERIENELIASMMRNMERHKAEEIKYGFNWSAWQAEQLKALERYRVNNNKHFGSDFTEINLSLDVLIREARASGGMKEEVRMLKNIQKGYKASGNNISQRRRKSKVTQDFFQSNSKKLDALITATVNDFEKAETAMLRRANDQYRKIIFNAQVYANTGAATYRQAVDMAAKDFLRAGINCIEYKNGARHTAKDYASMAIRTANKRAALMGAGEKRNEWGIRTVIVNSRSGACEKCLPFVGVVFIDDVWSGGSREDGKYPLLSTAISAGLFHPNCKDGTSTYYPGITTIPPKYTKEDIAKITEDVKRENRHNYAKKQAEKFGRLAEFSIDKDNQKVYKSKEGQWEKKVKGIGTSGIINSSNTKEDIKVNPIGSINKDIYKCINSDIVTDEVVITDERIAHIKERHPSDFERFCAYIPGIIEAPDYIIKANKPNTAVILKEIAKDGEKFQLVLRLKTAEDTPEFKNSVITFLKVNQRTWNKYLRNKEILYKKE